MTSIKPNTQIILRTINPSDFIILEYTNPSIVMSQEYYDRDDLYRIYVWDEKNIYEIKNNTIRTNDLALLTQSAIEYLHGYYSEITVKPDIYLYEYLDYVALSGRAVDKDIIIFDGIFEIIEVFVIL